uniref:Uncharacterized protein n=1 Tax=Anguilla anguilla TaxID=7936 RepID=A0A0E9VI13_ANGAN
MQEPCILILDLVPYSPGYIISIIHADVVSLTKVKVPRFS